MTKFISYSKKSKRAQREDDAAKRTLWAFSPITRVKPSGKVYNRREAKRVEW